MARTDDEIRDLFSALWLDVIQYETLLHTNQNRIMTYLLGKQWFTATDIDPNMDLPPGF